MDKMEFNYEQIEKYIKGELSTTEVQNFEKELAVNTSLKEEVALYKDVEASFSSHFKFEEENAAVETTLTNLGKKYAAENKEIILEEKVKTKKIANENSKPTIIKRLFPLAALAAAAALLLFIFNPFTKQMSPTQLAEQHFTAYGGLESLMSGTEINSEEEMHLIKLRKDGKNYYDKAEYALAKDKFKDYLAIKLNDTDVMLAKGSCEFKLNQTDAAIQTFQQIKNSNTAKWYLALSYLKNDEETKAKPILESLLDNKKYGAKVKVLLSDL